MKLAGLMRTHHCGELRVEHLGEEVVLCGWMNKYRNLGGLNFVDIRDKYGVTQLSFDDYEGDDKIFKELSIESVIKARGKVIARPQEAKNKNMQTGDVEVSVLELTILSSAPKDEMPFLPYGQVGASEDLRLKYRYLDLRTKKLQEVLALRSKITDEVRQVLFSEDFTEIETPILYKSTPEGARDYVVPSRVHPGKVYALPQSPQTLKQLLMIGGTDKYFQIARCFRDEDLRADRQPEFTQIDVEVSFATHDYLKNLATLMAQKAFNIKEPLSVPVLSYHEALSRFGCDKPDISFGLEHLIATNLFKDSDFTLFRECCEKEGLIKAIFLPESLGVLARKQIDALVEVVKPFGGKGVAWFKNGSDGVSGGISKFITPSLLESLERLGQTSQKGLWLFCADQNHGVAHASADALRRHLASELKLKKEGFHFLWVNDFPLHEWDQELQRFFAVHHPFTSPRAEDMDDFLSGDVERLKKVRADAYDLVLNGYEIGGGSVRIFNQEVQSKMFEVLGMSKEEIQSQFGFFVEALKYGTPPHAGIALGLDRVVMLAYGTDNIRDVIAFPKTASATDLMSNAPSSPAQTQLDELSMKWNIKER